MKKIPTLFERDWNGDRSRVINQVHPGCEWVLAGEGVPTVKLDGTCCMVRANKLYKRRELRKGDTPPPDFEQVDADPETGKTVGWVPVGDGPDDRWHREGFAGDDHWPDGTYELIGPKIQGNPEELTGTHMLCRHGIHPATILDVEVTRDFEGLRAYFVEHPWTEGIVWHHPDGRMAKIKLKDFGVKRVKI